MKKLLCLCLDTFTHNQVFSWPMKHLGAAVNIYGSSGNPDARIMRLMAEHSPDVVVWSGVCGGRAMPSADVLRSLRDNARSVMICWDAGHPDWHPYLESYCKYDTFDLVCGVDGSLDWPRRKQDLPCLCPINPEWYDDRAANTERPIDLGFMGSFDEGAGARRDTLVGLGELLTIRRRTGEPGPYRDYADFMLKCRATVNVAGCAGDRGQHVKARCVEAAWAGCMLFESAGSPLSQWVPLECYVAYDRPEGIRRVLLRNDYADYARSMGATLNKAMQPHHPRYFWERVLG